jgi:serine/threonine protein kinase
MQKHSAKGSPLYASPQLLHGLAYSGKCDVWSAGVVIIEMLTKKCPTYNAAEVHVN